ncbi:MAG: BrnT family toxin, partial [Chloroflexota bacterium]|nr:BrnT family toxin [Chloroflexota bacterium]
MRFEWDERKNTSNFRKHGVEFELASEVFSDPFASYARDQFVGGEERVRIMGLARDISWSWCLWFEHTERMKV